jgi:hypothetical protein
MLVQSSSKYLHPNTSHPPPVNFRSQEGMNADRAPRNHSLMSARECTPIPPQAERVKSGNRLITKDVVECPLGQGLEVRVSAAIEEEGTGCLEVGTKNGGVEEGFVACLFTGVDEGVAVEGCEPMPGGRAGRVRLSQRSI